MYPFALFILVNKRNICSLVLLHVQVVCGLCEHHEWDVYVFRCGCGAPAWQQPQLLGLDDDLVLREALGALVAEVHGQNALRPLQSGRVPEEL